MNTEEFIGKAAGLTGWYCLFSSINRANPRQSFFKTIPELLAAAAIKDAQGADTFFACGALKDNSSRKATNVATMSSLYIDLDCGDGKPYPNLPAGLTVLREFCAAYKLPKPMIVSSGRGAHIYWFLDTAHTAAEWKPVATRLKAVCVEYGLAIDPAVTADAARVLRIPGTHHHKDTPKKLVTMLGNEFPAPVSLAEFGELLGVEEVAGLGFTALSVPDSDSNAVLASLMGNTHSSFKEIVSKSLKGSGCEQLKIIITDQPNCPEPMWRAGLSIAKFCDDPTKGAHNLSKRHPDYSYEETEQKLSEIKGPYTCAVFDDNSPNVCPECPHWNRITSPIQLGRYVVEADEADNVVVAPVAGVPDSPLITYEIPKYPFPYFRGATGGVYIRKKNDEGDTEDVAVYHNDLYVVKRLRDVDMGECVIMRLHLPKDGVQEFMLQLSSVTSKEELRRELSKQGVAVAKTDALLHYITTWINNLQETTVAENAHRRYGWIGNNFDQFIAGPYDIRPDKILVNHPTSATAGTIDAFVPRGTLDGWKQAIAFYDKPGFEIHQYAICRAFGSLLMAMTQFHGSQLNLHSHDSGRGKTTSALAGLAVYGNPAKLMTEQKDTIASRMNRAEVYHNLMFLMDEVTNAEGKEHSDMAYAFTSGTQRNRMQGNVNTERHRADPWALLAVTTSNCSIAEKMSMYKAQPKAEMLRMLEYEVPVLLHTTADKVAANDMNILLNENYGHALIPFLQHVMQGPSRIRNILTMVMTRLDVSAGLGPEHRYWSADGTMTLLGGLVAQEIGLIPFDMKGLFRFTVGLIQENKRSGLSMGATTQESFNEFIFEHMTNMLQIQSTADLRGGVNALVVPSMMPKGALIIRYETDTKRAFVIAKNLRAWCIKQQLNYNSFLKDLMDTMGGKREKIRISKGTVLSMPPTNVISVNCDIPIHGVPNGDSTQD